MAASSDVALTPSSADASFPDPPASSGSQRPPSAISSRMTDIVSVDADEYYPEGLAAAGRTKAPGSLGATNDYTPPPSAISSQRSAWTQAPSSRRGVRDWKLGGTGTFGGPGAAFANTSRPESAASRTSRTHVPSITSNAFFRPMSSQRLQAQRGTRASAKGQSPSVAGRNEGNRYHEGGIHSERQSVGSLQTVTVRQGPIVHQDPEAVPPSRGTDFTERDYAADRTTATASPNGEGEGTVQSLDDSVRPLQNGASNTTPIHLNLDNIYHQGPGAQPPLQKSPHSFRPSFLRSNKSDPPPTNGGQNHSRLGSYSASQKSTQSNMPQERKVGTGRNYQYFSGNTAFCWGGRLQNTRGRPLNLATGFLVVLPSVLFLVFS
ncbi:MAG: hypothetical protein LQ347_000298 [Umbilicaria vellea]|nr:MAG: hypothetical protein LQ347_000298 [Umbilicaria vellea]